MNQPPRVPPFPFLVPGLLALVFGLMAGLIRLPWDLPVGASISLYHGPLMVSGFLGTVISVERAAALRRGWAWSVPALNGLGALFLLMATQLRSGLPFSTLQAGAFLFVAGGIGLVAIFVNIVRRQPSLFNIVMGLGAVAYLSANVLLLAGRTIPTVVPLWSAFLALTIAGERLELNRFLRPRAGMKALFVLPVGLVLLGSAISAVSAVWADRFLGAGFLVFGLWLLTNDIARRTIRTSGLPRFTAVCLIAGYAWLILAGVSLVGRPGQVAGLYYDATQHAFYVGFVLSMIFGHAPIIVPALLGKSVDFRSHFYLPLLLLHGSLVVRVVGDYTGWIWGRRWGGLLNELALVTYLLVVILAVRRSRVGNRG